jgi:hypothetical protein
MSMSLATNSIAQPLQLVNALLGSFDVRPLDTERLSVTSTKSGFLIGGLLYPFQGVMLKHEHGWRFKAETVLIPKLSPGAKARALEDLTRQINLYLESHPGYLEQLEVAGWHHALKKQQDYIKTWERDIEHHTRQISYFQERLVEAKQGLQKSKQELAEHLKNAPDGYEPEPEAAVQGEVIPG